MERHRKRTTLEKLVCQLAYTGFIFWLPLTLRKEDEEAGKIANQGLWALIMSYGICTLIRIFEIVNIFFKGTIFFSVSNALYGLIYVLALAFMLLLVYKSICNVKAIQQDKQVEDIFFFDEIRIIGKGVRNE